MILGTERTKPREIGGKYVGIKGLDYDQPFVVLREATYEEWAAERLQELGYVPDPPRDERFVNFSSTAIMAKT